MTILIIGGNRFVGKLLAEALIKLDQYTFPHHPTEVTVFNRKGTGPEGCIIIKGDRNNLEDLERINFAHFDCVIDMCLYNPGQFKLIELFLDVEKPYIFISSGAAYKDPDIWPIDENNELLGMEAYGNYGVEKAEVENLISKSNLKDYKILRPTYIVGEGNHNPRLGHYIKCLQNKEAIHIGGDGENLISLVFAEDIVNLIILMITSDKPKQEGYNVCNDEFLTINSLINIIAKELNTKRISKLTYHSTEAILPSNTYGVFKNDKVKTSYNIKFKNLKESLPSYIEWYNKNN
jgi:nucleoside-diphosphate-sugar epimerase